MNLFIPITKIDESKRIVYGTLTQAVPDKSGEIIDYETTKAAYQKWSDDASERSKGKSKGNLRAMHTSIAAGKFTDIVFDDENQRIEGAAYVSDDNEWKKCVDGTYTGFSHGGSYAKRWTDPENPKLKRYTPELAEVSLVDNPCVPTATFEFIKQDGSSELRKFNTNQEAPMKKDTTSESPTTDVTTDTVETPAAETQTETVVKADDAAPETETLEKTEPRDGHPGDKGGVLQGFQAKDGSFHLKKSDALKRNSEFDAEQAAAPALAALEKLDAAASASESTLEKKDPETSSVEAPKVDEAATDDTSSEAGAAEAEKTAGNEMKKGMYGVSRFAEMLQAILCFQQDTEWEADYEGDDSEMPAKLKAWLADGAALLVQMVGEEAAELTASKAAEVAELTKKGATLSAATKGHIEAMYKSASEHMDAVDKCYKSLGMGDDASEKVTKRAPDTDDAVLVENAALKKALGDMTPKLEGLLSKFEQQAQTIKAQNERIAHLEDQPAAPKGTLRVVEKASDGGNVSDGDAVTKVQEVLKNMSPEEVNMVLMKTALAKPKYQN